jgi:hypothetical protein
LPIIDEPADGELFEQAVQVTDAEGHTPDLAAHRAEAEASHTRRSPGSHPADQPQTSTRSPPSQPKLTQRRETDALVGDVEAAALEDREQVLVQAQLNAHRRREFRRLDRRSG